MAINTLSVATEGLLPNRNPLTIASRGWLGAVTGPIFFTGNDLIWSVFARQIEWSEPYADISWNPRKMNIKWQTTSLNTSWKLKNKDTTWNLDEE